VLCESCNKNEANIHYTEVVNGKLTELHLCEECAEEKGFEVHSPLFLDDFLGSLIDIQPHVLPEERVEERKCGCGMSYGDFKKRGKFGCGECYKTFSKQLSGVLRRIHGSTEHVGKVPTKIGEVSKLKQKIQKLKAELQEAVKREDFELAAELRDKIREMEENESK
jgi:protein arginine kinase activator